MALIERPVCRFFYKIYFTGMLWVYHVTYT
jgi:hypothetical protein